MRKHDYDEIIHKTEIIYPSEEDNEDEDEYEYVYELDESGDFVYEYDPVKNGLFKKIKKVVKKVTKPVTQVVKSTIKATEKAVKIAGKITKAAAKIAVNPGKAGQIIKDVSKSVVKDLKAAAKAYKPVVNEVKKEVKRAFKTVKAVAPYVGFVTCFVPVVGQIGLAASIAATMSTAYKAYALYQAGMSIYQGVKEKDFVSALGGIATAVGGSIGGTIGTVAQKAAEAQQLYKQGEMVYKGIKNGNYAQIISGVTSLISPDVAKKLISQSELLQQGLEYYQRGYDMYKKGKQVVESIKTGHFGRAIEGLAELGLDVRTNSLYTKAQELFEKGSEYYYQGETLYKQGKEKLELGKAAYDAAKKGDLTSALSVLKQAGIDIAKVSEQSQILKNALDIYSKGEQLYKQGDAIYKQGKGFIEQGKSSIESLRRADVTEAINDLKELGIDVTKYDVVKQGVQIINEVQKSISSIPQEIQSAAEITLAKLVLLGLNTTFYKEIDEALDKAKSVTLTLVKTVSDGLDVYKDASGNVGTIIELSEKRFLEFINMEGSSEFCRDLDLVAKIFTGSTVGEQIAQKVTEGYLKLEDAQAKLDSKIEKVAEEVQGKATKLVTSIDELKEIIAKAH
ncbi:hypothetical protein GPJ56_004160 [Histomonas meleagridis]|uniref:uncharacterized protein n=1 Tax=Histomonas meleagridis TaxID=135588 RepID=UPI00355A08B5|nr:hypothetical protein GPJ56_004160 [Histomonas meleagridis]KAH0801501.1 hypothetical protein GO595_005753 [Histomonas meleagridis]